ncbi:helix-turn-helix domain-containing protein [Bacillus sp. T33-2]|uniref:helix-turn-helix domain-containing protein n=1 Tax=Bacillus sp. T33-2 TaxID=2054168 RepID=UPI000C7732D8|nr:helix-turn-helix transcriptional regulator [Bacillus sp. T33-2]PLR91929.1 hypothetical protein CVD19_21300 [Bacillus sp. T33-2]
MQKIPRHKHIGEKIREARKMRGMTLGELADGICSLGKMSNIENGHRSVTNEELERISEKLDFPMSYFSDPDIKNKIKELEYFKHKLGDLIGIEHWEYMESELNKFHSKIES